MQIGTCGGGIQGAGAAVVPPSGQRPGPRHGEGAEEPVAVLALHPQPRILEGHPLIVTCRCKRNARHYYLCATARSIADYYSYINPPSDRPTRLELAEEPVAVLALHPQPRVKLLKAADAPVTAASWSAARNQLGWPCTMWTHI